MAETTPTDSELCSSKGLPIAATGSPTTTAAEWPSGTGARAWSEGRTFTTATSLEEIPADDRGGHPVAVAELDVELVGPVHRAASRLGRRS